MAVELDFSQDEEMELTDKQYDLIANKLITLAHEKETLEGTEWVMFLGVTNAIFVAWTFGVYPEYIWLIFCVEGVLLFVLRLRNVIEAKAMPMPGEGNPPQKMFRVLYMLEFCYYANYAGLVVAVIVALNPPWFTQNVARQFFAAGFGVSGSLLGATAAFGNQLLFHDVDNTVSVFIHFFPALVFYSLRWHYDRFVATWPNLFYRGPFDDIALWEIAWAAAVFYATWFTPYIVWMLLGGSRLPQNKTFDTCLRLNKSKTIPHDTIFHFNMRENIFGQLTRRARGHDTKEWQGKCNEHDFGCCDVFAYMFLHACCNICGPLFSLLLYISPYAGGCAIAGVLVLTLRAGSGRYSKMIHMSKELQNLKLMQKKTMTKEKQNYTECSSGSSSE